MRIGIDLMGSDSSPEIIFEAVLDASEKLNTPAQFVVFLTNDSALTLFAKYKTKFFQNSSGSKIDFCLVQDVISMDEEPLTAIRLKRNSSLCVGIKQIGEQRIDAFVTAGNTGALIAAATIGLNPLGSFDRSALLALLPTKKRPLAIIDVGGNISCKPRQLVLYAFIGAAYQRCMMGIEIPKVGVLNIGSESKKGTSELREVYGALQEYASRPDSKIAFIGNIEGREIFLGNVDVLVTDGFTGNILLKTSEGISSYIFDAIRETIKQTDSEDLHHNLENLQGHFNYEKYPGALVCGVDGILIKCHGAATRESMKNSILGAIALVQNNLLEKMRLEL